MSAPETLVLVHGCGWDAGFWDELRPHLDGLRVVVPALPGRAKAGGEPPTSAAAAARWLRGELRTQGVERASVVGHSYGGAIALEMALQPREPDDPVVTGLGLVSTGARLRVHPAILEAVSAAARTGVPADLARFAFHPTTDGALVERAEARAQRIPPATAEQDWRATHAFDRLGQLGAVDVPTVVVVGSDDMLTPVRYARYLADEIPGARLEQLEGAGHMLPIEQPAALAGVLRRFYEG